MKKTTRTTIVMATALMLSFSQLTFAEPSDTLKAVYDALISENSDFSRSQAQYAEYYEDVSMNAELKDDGITIAIDSTNEYVEAGSWDFVQEGDYLNIVLEEDNYAGAFMAQMILSAAVSAQGVNTSLFNGYLSALTLTDSENKYLVYEEDEAAGTAKVSINIAGPYDMEGLDEMALTEDVLTQQGFEPLNEEYRSQVINFGKVSLLVNGNVDEASFLVMEYGDLDELAYQAVMSAAKVMQPKGWEAFSADYTELKDAEEDGFSAALNVDEDTVKEIIDDPAEGYSYAVFTIGQAE